ncbi:MAG TPA: PrgI family protein [Bacillota bacterium]|nr:PrgI family protein [Bacillota bacterium]
MSTYKVLQDVEAEDKLIGPLSLRQFVYAGIAAINLYLCWFLATHGATFLIAVFFPIAAVSAFFAFPWGRDQPTELWALAKIRFLIKPRRRIWDQDGVKELVTVTAPKHVQVDYTNGLSQSEVQSRLHALAATIDSRGWAIKNANLNLVTQPTLVMNEPRSDRLIGPSALPQPVSNVEVTAQDDILDEKNNPDASRVDSMISASAKAHRDKIVEDMNKPEPLAPPPPSAPVPLPNSAPPQRPANYWFLNQPAQSTSIPNNMVTFNTQVVTPVATNTPAAVAQPAPDPVATGAAFNPVTAAPGPTAPVAADMPDEARIVAELDARKQVMPTTAYYSHLHTIQPLSAQSQPGTGQSSGTPPSSFYDPGYPMQNAQAAQAQNQVAPSPGPTAPPAATANVPAPVTPAQQAAILQLSRNDDLNVATIAREAERAAPQDEVVIKLH